MSIPPHFQQFLQTGVLQPPNGGDQQPQFPSNGLGMGPGGFNGMPMGYPPAGQQSGLGQQGVPGFPGVTSPPPTGGAAQAGPDLQQLLSAQTQGAADSQQQQSSSQASSGSQCDPEQTAKNAAANLPLLQAFLNSTTPQVATIQQPQPQMMWHPYYGWIPNPYQTTQPTLNTMPLPGLQQITDGPRPETPTPSGMPKNRVSAVHQRADSPAPASKLSRVTTMPQDTETAKSSPAGFDEARSPAESILDDRSPAWAASDAYSDAPLSAGSRPSFDDASRDRSAHSPAASDEYDVEAEYRAVKNSFHQISESNPFDESQRSNSQGRIGSRGAVDGTSDFGSPPAAQTDPDYDSRASASSFNALPSNLTSGNAHGLGLSQGAPSDYRDSMASVSDYHRQSAGNRSSVLSTISNKAYIRNIPSTRSSLAPSSAKGIGMTLPNSPRPGQGMGLPLSPRPPQSHSAAGLSMPSPSSSSSPSDRAKSYIRARPSKSTRTAGGDEPPIPRMPSLLRAGHASSSKRFSEIPDDGIPFGRDSMLSAPYPRTGKSQRKSRSSVMGRGQQRGYPSDDDDDILDGYMN